VTEQVIELKNITPQPGRPLYMVVKDAVRAAIDAGRFQPGDRLPSTKVLSERMNVSLVTAHRALQELVSAGVLRRPGQGTYVHEDYGRTTRRGLGYRLGIVFHADSSLADAYNGQIFEGAARGQQSWASTRCSPAIRRGLAEQSATAISS
jgi:DNA-binding transcriptional MocR family regulator